MTAGDPPVRDPAADTDAAPGRCYRHPNREASIRCTRCDRFICPDCMRPASVGFHCPDDVELARRTTRLPKTAFGGSLLHTFPWVTVGLIAVNVIIYLVTAAQSVGGFSQPGDGSSPLFRAWQLAPAVVNSDGSYYRLITAAFLHVSLLHIGSNMLALAVIGPPIERLLGTWRFSALYLLSAIGGSAAVFALGQVDTPEVGASGAIFGLFGAALILWRKLGLDLQALIGVIVLNFVLTFSIHNISKLGHIGGFITGVLAAVAIAGLPRVHHRLSAQSQLAGLGAVVVLLAGTIVVRASLF